MPLPLSTDLTLRGGDLMPARGFGVFDMDHETTATAVSDAIGAGYRSVDTAAVYGNERGVGEGIRRSGIDPAGLFVTTKLWNDHHLIAPDALAASLERLGLDRVDLYLIHWPATSVGHHLTAWESLLALRDHGLARNVGVSNFSEALLDDFDSRGLERPAVNQIELHPLHSQARLRQVHAARGIATQAWSPLGRGLAFGHPAVVEIAARLGVSEAQVVLRWQLQLGVAALPKSATRARIRSNFDLLGFELTLDDMAAVDALESGRRVEDDYYQ